MMKKTLYGAVTLVLVAAAAVSGYLIGRNSVEPVAVTTFYATIDEIDGNALVVSGLEINDINGRGQFSFLVEKDTTLEWRNTPIKLTDLKEGDRISITYTGGVTESYPAGLEKIVKLQLLEDEI